MSQTTPVVIYAIFCIIHLTNAQFYEELGPHRIERIKRQISYPPGPSQQAPQVPTNAGNGGMFGFLSDLGPQVERVKQFSSLFSTSQQPLVQPQVGQSQPLQAQSQQTPGASATQLLSQLSDLMRSSQTRTPGAQQSGQQIAQNAQSGLTAALSEMVQGVQRIAMNNPMLLPEVKNLFQSVSSRLSSTSNQQQAFNNNQIVPAKNADQLVDNLTKVALMPQS